MYHNFLIHLSADGHLGCFHVLAIVHMHCSLRLSLVVVSRGYSGCCAQVSHCGFFSCCRTWALGLMGSIVAAHELSCSVACGIFLNQGSNLCLLYRQVDSLPLSPREIPEKNLCHLKVKSWEKWDACMYDCEKEHASAPAVGSGWLSCS